MTYSSSSGRKKNRRKSLGFIVLGPLGLPRGYLRQGATPWVSLFWGYWIYLEATFAIEQILRFHCSAVTRRVSLVWGHWGYLSIAIIATQSLLYHFFFAICRATTRANSPTNGKGSSQRLQHVEGFILANPVCARVTTQAIRAQNNKGIEPT